MYRGIYLPLHIAKFAPELVTERSNSRISWGETDPFQQHGLTSPFALLLCKIPYYQQTHTTSLCVTTNTAQGECKPLCKSSTTKALLFFTHRSGDPNPTSSILGITDSIFHKNMAMPLITCLNFWSALKWDHCKSLPTGSVDLWSDEESACPCPRCQEGW